MFKAGQMVHQFSSDSGDQALLMFVLTQSKWVAVYLPFDWLLRCSGSDQQSAFSPTVPQLLNPNNNHETSPD